MKFGRLATVLIAAMFGIILGFLISWGYVEMLVNFSESVLLIDVLFVILAVLMIATGTLLAYIQKWTIGQTLISIAVVVLAAIILRFVGIMVV